MIGRYVAGAALSVVPLGAFAWATISLSEDGDVLGSWLFAGVPAGLVAASLLAGLRPGRSAPWLQVAFSVMAVACVAVGVVLSILLLEGEAGGYRALAAGAVEVVGILVLATLGACILFLGARQRQEPGPGGGDPES